MRFLSLFSGIGGLDLGLEWAGWTPAAFCEQDEQCRWFLRRQWPGVACHNDVRTLDPDGYGRIDAIVGGFPCQDISSAGKGLDLAASVPACGGRCTVQSDLFDPFGSLLKMSLLSAHAELTGFSNHWRESATPHGRSWSVLIHSEPRTGGSGCLSSDDWQTPTASGIGSRCQVGKTAREPLLPDQAVKCWPTATKSDENQSGSQGYGGQEFETLTDAAQRAWPTAMASDDGHKVTIASKQRNLIGESHHSPHAPTTTPDGEWCSKFVQSLPRRRLNPAFVEWLMGFPCGWLDATTVSSSDLSEMLYAPRSGS